MVGSAPRRTVASAHAGPLVLRPPGWIHTRSRRRESHRLTAVAAAGVLTMLGRSEQRGLVPESSAWKDRRPANRTRWEGKAATQRQQTTSTSLLISAKRYAQGSPRSNDALVHRLVSLPKIKYAFGKFELSRSTARDRPRATTSYCVPWTVPPREAAQDWEPCLCRQSRFCARLCGAVRDRCLLLWA